MEDRKQRAQADAAHYAMENCPFASVGGLESRAQLVAPVWAAGNEAAYLEGYEVAALRMYGPHWRTCLFGITREVPGDAAYLLKTRVPWNLQGLVDPGVDEVEVVMDEDRTIL